MTQDHGRGRAPSLATLAVQAGHHVDPVTGAITPSIHPSTTFARDRNYELIGDYVYSRYSTPGDNQAERLLSQLEGGAEAKLFGSGLAAFATLFELLRPGQHVVAPTIMYHGGQAWLRRLAETRNIGLSLFDATEEGALRQAIRPGETAIVWIETPVNPTWDVIDIAAAAEAAHDNGALLGVDSTVATPVLTRPLEHGADIVFHSATKYLNGHSDLTAGVLVTGSARRPLGRDQAGPRPDGRRVRPLRVLAAAARTENPVPAGRARLGQRPGDRRALRGACQAARRALPGPGEPSGARGRQAPDDRRLRRHDVAQGRRRGGAGQGGRDRPTSCSCRRPPWAAWKAWSSTGPRSRAP